MPRRRSNPVTQQPSEPAQEESAFPTAFHQPLVPGHVSDEAQPELTGPTVAVALRIEEGATITPEAINAVSEATAQQITHAVVANPRPVAYSPPEPSSEPFNVKSQFVLIKRGQVGIYGQGSIVPATVFPDLRRLFDLDVVEWAAPDAQPSEIDEHAAIAVSLSRPIQAPGSIGRAPWVQSSAADLLGPATPRPSRIDLLSEPFPAFQTINVAR